MATKKSKKDQQAAAPAATPTVATTEGAAPAATEGTTTGEAVGGASHTVTDGRLHHTEIVPGIQVGLPNPRTVSDKKKDQELEENLKLNPVYNPLQVWKVPGSEPATYVILGGNRRLTKVQKLVGSQGELWYKKMYPDGLPVRIHECDELEARKVAFIDNDKRADLTGYDRTAEIVSLKEAMTKKEGVAPSNQRLAQDLNKSVAWVQQHLQAWSVATVETKAAWRDGRLTDQVVLEVTRNYKAETAEAQNEAVVRILTILEGSKGEGDSTAGGGKEDQDDKKEDDNKKTGARPPSRDTKSRALNAAKGGKGSKGGGPPSPTTRKDWRRILMGTDEYKHPTKYIDGVRDGLLYALGEKEEPDWGGTDLMDKVNAAETRAVGEKLAAEKAKRDKAKGAKK